MTLSLECPGSCSDLTLLQYAFCDLPAYDDRFGNSLLAIPPFLSNVAKSQVHERGIKKSTIESVVGGQF